MSHEITPPPSTDKAKVKAFSLLMKVAFHGHKPSLAETDAILSKLCPVLRHNMECYVNIWSPSNIQDYAESCKYPVPTDDQAKDILRNLDGYEHLYSAVNESVYEEIQALDRSGAND